MLGRERAADIRLAAEAEAAVDRSAAAAAAAARGEEGAPPAAGTGGS